MQQFLAETFFCDINSKAITHWVEQIAHLNDTDKAIFIREFIATMPYQLDVWNLKASEVLANGYGMCGNKANLQVALLRKSGIPSAYGFMDISKEAFREYCPPDFYAQIHELTQHVFCYVYLNQRWIACDATPDRKSSPKPIRHFDIRLSFWNATTDFKMPSAYVIKEYPMTDNLDEFFMNKTRFTKEQLNKINHEIKRFINR